MYTGVSRLLPATAPWLQGLVKPSSQSGASFQSPVRPRENATWPSSTWDFLEELEYQKIYLQSRLTPEIKSYWISIRIEELSKDSLAHTGLSQKRMVTSYVISSIAWIWCNKVVRNNQVPPSPVAAMLLCCVLAFVRTTARLGRLGSYTHNPSGYNSLRLSGMDENGLHNRHSQSLLASCILLVSAHIVLAWMSLYVCFAFFLRRVESHFLQTYTQNVDKATPVPVVTHSSWGGKVRTWSGGIPWNPWSFWALDIPRVAFSWVLGLGTGDLTLPVFLFLLL